MSTELVSALPAIMQGLASSAGPYVLVILLFVVMAILIYKSIPLLNGLVDKILDRQAAQIGTVLERQDKHIASLIKVHDEDRILFKDAITSLTRSLDGIEESVHKLDGRVERLDRRVGEIEEDIRTLIP